METICLADLWRQRLESKNWSPRASEQFKFFIADSTLQNYDRQLNNFKTYCISNGHTFPPTEDSASAVLASYMCSVADRSTRPESQLKCILASVGHYYAACDKINPVDQDIMHLMSALIKSGTHVPARRTKVMPCEPFHVLFESWPENDQLSTAQLRQKAVTLLALTTMSRPSDLAPLARVFNPEACGSESLVFSTDKLIFNSDGSLTIIFFGTKNDSDRSGFEVRIPAGGSPKTDPVSTLRCYIETTSNIRTHSPSPVFLTLKKPHRAVSNANISDILRQSIKDAGLQGQGFTARSFRPTGATAAVKAQVNPSTVRQIGRWKNDTVFYERYVYPIAPTDYTDKVMSFQGLDNP